ncbi:MAG: hypothetical protein Q8831_00435, partial ['Bonamia sp.' little leaf phytoplasma]|nr:hypothetical protein ['Bonamia sp.' little leaf phytoplasma]
MSSSSVLSGSNSMHERSMNSLNSHLPKEPTIFDTAGNVIDWLSGNMDKFKTLKQDANELLSNNPKNKENNGKSPTSPSETKVEAGKDKPTSGQTPVSPSETKVEAGKDKPTSGQTPV